MDLAPCFLSGPRNLSSTPTWSKASTSLNLVHLGIDVCCSRNCFVLECFLAVLGFHLARPWPQNGHSACAQCAPRLLEAFQVHACRVVHTFVFSGRRVVLTSGLEGCRYGKTLWFNTWNLFNTWKSWPSSCTKIVVRLPELTAGCLLAGSCCCWFFGSNSSNTNTNLICGF